MGFLDDLKMGLGMKEKTQDYKDRTEKTKAINKAVSSGDTSAFKDDPAMMSRYKRESMMSKMGDSNDNSGIKSISNGNATAEDDMADQYAENLRRYNEYMQSQQPQQPTVTPEMRREALNIFESQQGAGQVPYYMAAARRPRFMPMIPGEGIYYPQVGEVQPQLPENRMPGYGGMGTQPTSAPPNFASILASRFGGFGGQ